MDANPEENSRSSAMNVNNLRNSFSPPGLDNSHHGASITSPEPDEGMQSDDMVEFLLRDLENESSMIVEDIEATAREKDGEPDGDPSEILLPLATQADVSLKVSDQIGNTRDHTIEIIDVLPHVEHTTETHPASPSISNPAIDLPILDADKTTTVPTNHDNTPPTHLPPASLTEEQDSSIERCREILIPVIFQNIKSRTRSNSISSDTSHSSDSENLQRRIREELTDERCLEWIALSKRLTEKSAQPGGQLAIAILIVFP